MPWALSRLGLDVAALVKLGRDRRAETILARLMDQGVSPRWVSRDHRAPTGASVLISSHDRNAAVFTFRGANTLLEPVDLPDAAFAVDAVYITALSSHSAACFPIIVEKAKAQSAIVAANPGIKQLSADDGAFLASLKFVDILAVNHSEAAVLVPRLVARLGEGGPPLAMAPGEGAPRLAIKGVAGGGHEMSLARFFSAITDLGPKYVVLTDGGHGAFVGSKDEILFCPAADCPVIGTAGAGDAFSATFTGYITLGSPPDKALRAATLNAASVVGHVDTQTGLLTQFAIETALTEHEESMRINRWRL